MGDRNSDFMSRVVPWPGGMSSPGWVNLHWKSPAMRDPTRDVWGGRPVKTINDFMWWLNWTKERPTIKDIYFCTSLQAEAGKNTKGNPKVVRSKDLAISLKAIWLDVDVKEPPKGYSDLNDAVANIVAFVKSASLPPPSAMVASGGGVHVYWLSAVPLDTAAWQPYAEGLKSLAIKHGLRCDAGVTTDAARVLRVPGTLNHKTNPPQPTRVLLLRPPELDYDFPASLGFLATLVPVTAKAGPTLGWTPSAAWANVGTDSLADGILEEYPPLDWQPIARECAFIRDALTTGGKDYAQPMWNLTTLAATFLENGHALAHKMGEKHSGYSRESTDALWDRKHRERTDRGLGWPSCKAIQASGCGACATCPHFAKGRSPLAISAPIRTITAEGNVVLKENPEADLALPTGYILNDEGQICKLQEQKVRGQPVGSIPVQLFHSRLSKPWVQGHPKALCFITTSDRGKTNEVSIPLKNLLPGTEMWKMLQDQEVVPVPRQRSECEGFLMAWLSKLQDAKSAINSLPFGWWHGEDGVKHGFVYGGVIMKDDGTEAPSGLGDNQVKQLYKPVGSLGPWMHAAKMITDQKRPELEAILAASFAGPLVTFTGEYSCLVSAWGPSGAGKSTAVKVASSVWGHPKKSKEVTMSTARSVVHKMGQLKNLPVFWDEIKDKHSQKNVFDVFFTGTEGVGPSRLTSNIEMRERGDWQTMLCITANLSFVDYIVANQPTTDAGVYRTFEYETHKPDTNAPGMIDDMEAGSIAQALEHNFGVMGMRYAKMLALDPPGIEKVTKEITTAFGQEVNRTQPERYWVATCGTLIAAATFANTLGVAIDVPALRAFLLEQFHKNRSRNTAEATQGGSLHNTEEALAGFLSENTGYTIYTDTFPAGRGAPKSVNTLHSPRMDSGRGVKVQWATTDRVLRFRRDDFRDYLHGKTTPYTAIWRGLQAHFKATEAYAKLAAGTSFVALQSKLISIPIPVGSPLEELMNAHNTVDISAPVTTVVVPAEAAAE